MKIAGMDQWTDEQLLDSIRQGDEAAAHMLYQRHAAYAINLASRFVHDKADAEDVAQDVWLALHQHLKRRGNVTEFKPYLVSAIVNRCRKVGAKRRADSDSLDAGFLAQLELREPDSVSTAEDLPGKAEQRHLIRTMSRCLSKQELQAVKLRYVHDYSYAEMSEILGKTESRARQITHRALHTLRKELGVED